MSRIFKQLPFFAAWLLIVIASQAQEISFSQLNATNGLSDNFVKSLAVDQNGFLWVGTADGLNRYDGYGMTIYSIREFSEIPSNYISHLFCDSHNRIWMGTGVGAAFVDEKRNIHRILLDDSISKYNCSTIYETKLNGIVLYTSKGQYAYNEKSKTWTSLPWIPPGLAFPHFVDAINFDENKILFATDSAVTLLDYSSKRIVFEQPFKRITSVCHVAGNKIAMVDNDGLVRLVDIGTNQVLRQWQLTNNANGKEVNEYASEIRMASNGDLLIGTAQTGLVTISPEGIVSKYMHSPGNNRSIAQNTIYRVLGNSNGDVITGSARNGASICNFSNKQVTYNQFFNDRNGNFFDDFLNEIAFDSGGDLWISASDRMIRWNREKNVSEFYKYKATDTSLGPKDLQFYRLCIDHSGQVWASILYGGLAHFDKGTNSFRLVHPIGAINKAVKNKFVMDIYESSDHRLWIGTPEGFYILNPITLAVDLLDKNPLLKTISDKQVNGFVEDRQQRIWISTSNSGVYCYDPNKNTLKNFTKKDGLVDDVSLELLADRIGNIYISTFRGFSMITPDKKIFAYTRDNGLRYSKCDAFVEDNQGMVWISNAKCLIKFNPATHAMDFYDEKSGLTPGGYKASSAVKAPDGELFWGTQSGINYFYPDQISQLPDPLQVSIYQVQAGDSLISTVDNTSLRVPFSKNNIQIYFTAINLKGSRNIRYEYMLEGFDEKWQVGTDIREARYSSLPPGKYLFKLRSSTDRTNWVNSNNIVRFSIVAPLWRRWWFQALVLVAILAAIYGFYRHRLGQTKKMHLLQLMASNLEREKTEILYQNLMNQFNPHFLFNSLTSLNSLIYDDQQLASEFLEHLSQVYRYLLTNKENKLVSIGDEIAFVESYISLLRIRFEKGLEVTIDIPEGPRKKKIVPVTFQILIENAIKHNIIDADSPLHIRFSANGNYINVSNNMQRKGYVETSNRKGLVHLHTMYKFLSPLPLIVEEDSEGFHIRVPMV